MTKKLVVALLIFMLVEILMVGCSFVVNNSSGKCDAEGYLIDTKSQEELFAALSRFEHQYNLSFDYGYAAPSCGSKGIDVALEYETLSGNSKYGIVYELLVLATYAPDSGAVTLHLSQDDISQTEDALAFIDSLQGTITEFESKPQVKEFATFFSNEGVDLRGTVHDEDSLWIETDPKLAFPDAKPSLSANISYSISTNSIYHYSLPNYLTWHEFPEIPIIHKIVNEHLLIGELSNCMILTNKEVYANTSVIFRTDSTIGADVRIICKDTGESKSLSLSLRPDGSYEYSIKK